MKKKNEKEVNKRDYAIMEIAKGIAIGAGLDELLKIVEKEGV